MNERDYHDEHYAEAGALFDSAIFGRVHARAVRDFLACTRIGRSHRMLSLGCGDGSIERRLAGHVGSITGVDISPVAIARARANSGAFANLSFHVSDSVVGGEFDAIAAFAFLHHLDDAAIRKTLRTARRALRPGGIFYSSDPSSRRLVGLFRGLVRGAYERHHSPDERELEPKALAALFVEAGFDAPAIVYTDFFLGPLAWLAPGAPAWLAAALEALDNFALLTPLVRRTASSFSLCACSTS